MQATQSTTSQENGSAAKAGKRVRVTPKADIFETETTFGVLLDVPGVGQEALEISLENQVLTVQAPACAAHNTHYFRRFRLNSSVDPSGVEAKLKNGVLELTLPKRAESQRKIISLSTH